MERQMEGGRDGEREGETREGGREGETDRERERESLNLGDSQLERVLARFKCHKAML